MIPLLLLLALAAPPARADSPAPALAFMDGDKVVLSVTAADLRARKSARTVEIEDPLYEGKRKRYRAAPLKDLLTAAYGGAWLENGGGEFFFSALDGYRSHAKVPLLAEDGAFVAFEDLDDPAWETLPREKAKPGPFYLIWTGTDQTLKKGYPWPWQIASVKSAMIEDEYPKAVPRNTAPDSRATSGWTLFKRNCIACHAMNGQGGSVGPDLNEPRGITSYHNKSDLKAFIRKASSFRHTKMPDFENLSPRDLKDLIAYFDFMAVQSGTK